MTNPALVFDPSGLSQRGLMGGEWRQLKQYSFFTSKWFGPSGDEIFGFIWQNVSFKDTLSCQ
jgi:hypothetical protein